MRILTGYVVIFLLSCLCDHCCAQETRSALANVSGEDTSLSPLQRLPSKYYSEVNKKTSSVNDHLTKKSLKYLAKFQRQEQRLQQKLQKIQPGFVITNPSEKYTELSQKIKNKTSCVPAISGGEYSPNLDSLGASLSFLQQFNNMNDKAKGPFASFNQLQSSLQQSEKIKEFIAERKNQMKEILSKYTKIQESLKNEYDKLNKTAYYYSAQVNEYKDLLNSPDKLEQKALSILNKIPAFQKFMKENGQLASFFRMTLPHHPKHFNHKNHSPDNFIPLPWAIPIGNLATSFYVSSQVIF